MGRKGSLRVSHILRSRFSTAGHYYALMRSSDHKSIIFEENEADHRAFGAPRPRGGPV